MNDNNKRKRKQGDLSDSDGSSDPDLSSTTLEELKLMFTEQRRKRKQAERREKHAKREAEKAIQEEKKKGSVYTSIGTLLQVPEGKLKVSPKGTGESHKPRNHYAATADVCQGFNLYSPDLNKLEEERPVSLLLSEFVSIHQQTVDTNTENLAEQLNFHELQADHEADYAALIRSATLDAIHLVEITLDNCEKLTANLERALFSVRPDIMVVRNSKRMGVLAIEVKRPRPGEGFDKLVSQGKILGHVFDQAQALRAFGKGTSIVILSTFQESTMCSVDQSVFETETSHAGQSSNLHSESMSSSAVPSSQVMQPREAAETPQAGQSSNSHSESMSSSAVPSSQAMRPREAVESPQASPLPLKPLNSLHATQSPPRTEFPPEVLPAVSKDSSSPSTSSTSSDSKSESSSCSLFTKELNRKMWRSEQFGPHNLVLLIYTALILALKKYKESPRKMLKFQPGVEYKLKAIQSFEGEEYHWGELRFKVDQPVFVSSSQRSPRRQTQENKPAYYVIGELGYGSTSNVFHAFNSQGKEVAIKIFLSNVGEDGKPLQIQQFKEQARKATLNEVNHLKKFYPFLQEKVKQVQVFGHWGIVMPVFKSIEPENRNSDWLNINVKPVANAFAQALVKYKEGDMMWRHVGTYGTRCILYDLADLEPIKDRTEDFAETFCAKLLEREEARLGITDQMLEQTTGDVNANQ